MRSILTALLIAFFVLLFTVGVLAPKLPEVVGIRPDVREHRTLSWPKAALVRLDNQDGFIRVRGREGDEVTAKVELRAYARGDVAEEDVRAYVAALLDVTEAEDYLEIVTEPEERPDSIDLVVLYTLEVPLGTDLEITTADGNVTVSPGCGNVSIHGRNSDIAVQKPQGHVVAQTTNGRIKLHDAPAGARAETVNGSVFVWMQGGAFEATTTNGDIVAHVLDPKVESCALNTQNGGITVVMNEACTAYVNGTTERGTVGSEFPVDASAGVALRHHLEGSIGEGKTRLSLDTLNGNIRIVRSKR
ncbi:MAG: DUF4097 domain-containing protein [bacterium]|nr:DUF4097 domain-containing protein [bacterium]